MDDWQKEINWKVVAIEKIVNRLLSEVHEITTALRQIEQKRNEIEKESRRYNKDPERTLVSGAEPSRREIKQIVMANTPNGLKIAHRNANWIVRQKDFYLPDGLGSYALENLEEVLKNTAKLDKAMELYPEAFSKTADVQKTEAAPKKKAAPKK